VGNVAERGSLATVGGPSPTLKKYLKMKVCPDVDLYILKPENCRKTTVQKLPKNAKNN